MLQICQLRSSKFVPSDDAENQLADSCELNSFGTKSGATCIINLPPPPIGIGVGEGSSVAVGIAVSVGSGICVFVGAGTGVEGVPQAVITKTVRTRKNKVLFIAKSPFQCVSVLRIAHIARCGLTIVYTDRRINRPSL
ncbi:MAG: hypothetical protein DCC59_10335 [Chloroflexi bacterium]|nr:MAG: hypothetical protein DCC59_10335 [Chloroflexota bacterium]